METKEATWPNFVVPALLIAAFLIVFYFFVYRPPARSDLEGVPVQELSLEPFVMSAIDQDKLQGLDAPKTAADLQGKVTLISFWATWCGPCQQELPHLGAIAKHFEDDPDVQIWTVLVGNREGEAAKGTVEQIFNEAEVALPVYAPSGPLLPESLVPQGIPAVLLIGPDGKVAGAWVGYNPNLESDVVQLVSKLQKTQKAKDTKETEVAKAI